MTASKMLKVTDQIVMKRGPAIRKLAKLLMQDCRKALKIHNNAELDVLRKLVEELVCSEVRIQLFMERVLGDKHWEK